MPITPPYVLEFPESALAEKQPERPKKRKGGKIENGSKKDNHDSNDRLIVKTYTVPNMGPYPEDVPRKNTVRFTPVQCNWAVFDANVDPLVSTYTP